MTFLSFSSEMIAKLGNTFTTNDKRQIQAAISQNRDGLAKNCLKFLWMKLTICVDILYS